MRNRHFNEAEELKALSLEPVERLFKPEEITDERWTCKCRFFFLFLRNIAIRADYYNIIIII